MVTALLRQIVEALDDPVSIQMTSEELKDATRFSLWVAPSDLGKLIGRQGRTARSLRIILRAMSVKFGHEFRLDIVQDEGSCVRRLDTVDIAKEPVC